MKNYNCSNVNEFASNLKRKIYKEKRDLAFVCIGNNQIVGDSLGPLVGSYLKNNSNLEVFGDINNNICEKEDLEKIYPKLKDKCVLAIDSAISNYGIIGEIFITKNPLKVATGMNLDKGTIGDISIKGIVARNKCDPYKNFLNLQNSDLYFLRNLAVTIGQGIKRAVW